MGWKFVVFLAGYHAVALALGLMAPASHCGPPPLAVAAMAMEAPGILVLAVAVSADPGLKTLPPWMLVTTAVLVTSGGCWLGAVLLRRALRSRRRAAQGASSLKA